MRPRVCFDIDQVLATGSIDEVYSDEAGWAFDKCTPIHSTVELIDELSKRGVEIWLHTARFEEDREKTERWLEEHDIAYDGLTLGKPQADLYVDDKNYPVPFLVGDKGHLERMLWQIEVNKHRRTRDDG